MTSLPQRYSLVSQTVEILRREIRRRNWQEWLPGERILSGKLQISRCTLRSALRQLAQEKQIAIVPGKGHRITAASVSGRMRLISRDVALLTPELLDRLRPAQILWLDELRAMLAEHGCNLHLIPTPSHYKRNPDRALRHLVKQSPHACWILMQADVVVQEWFFKAKMNCLVAGSPHAGVGLPFRDLDHQATSRHAAGVLLGLGHRRIACVSPDSQLAGNVEGEKGFVEAVKRSSHTEAEAILVRHDGSPKGIERLLRQLMRQDQPPTGLLVSNAYHYLAVASHCAHLRVRIPQDLSVIVRSGDAFLRFLSPEPARYKLNPQLMAKAMLRPLLEMLKGGVVTQREARLMPEFVRGESIDAASGRAGLS